MLLPDRVTMICITVTVTNSANLTTTAYSNDLLVDADPPVLGSVYDGDVSLSGPRVDFDSFATQYFAASWDAPMDGIDGSGVASITVLFFGCSTGR